MLRNRKTTDGSSRRRLGRGLESLVSKPVPIDVASEDQKQKADVMPTASPAQAVESKPSKRPPTQDLDASAFSQTSVRHGGQDGISVRAIALDLIRANRHQPRQSMDDASLESLAQSIRQAGLMQPIVVRPDSSSPGQFELVAGERRWRAAQRIGLKTIPALVRDVDERSAAELALIENIQREDLNPIDRAEAFERLINDFDLTHQELAQRVGLDRSTITNFTRLTTLDDYSREMVRSGKLTLGHAKVLLAITSDKARADLATKVVRQGWSVRELERHVQHLRKSDGDTVASTAQPTNQPAHLTDLQRRLSEHLGTKVRLKSGSKKGTGSMTIDFYTLDQFDGLMQRLGFATSDAYGS